MAQVVDKQEAHDLIDQMPAEQVPAAVSLLKSMLHSSIDDEPVTDEEHRAILEAEAWLKANGGRGIPMEEVLADFGLIPGDLPLQPRFAPIAPFAE